MAWNDSGGPQGNRNQNPWGQWGGGNNGGGGNNNQQPPDLDEILRKLKAKFSGSGGGSGGGFGDKLPTPGGIGPKGIGIGAGVVVAIWLASGFYVIQPDEQGAVKRFGAHVRTTAPGLHYHMPYPIETVQAPKVTQVKRMEVGFRSREGTQESMHIPKEALMLTGDENIVDLQFAVQYRIKDAGNYLYNVKGPNETMREVAETSIRQVVGKRPLDDVLTRARAEVAQETKKLMQSLVDDYKAGLRVTDIALQSAQAPEPVRPAFRDVISAREDRARAQNEAQAYRNDILPRARGRAERILQEAQGYAAQTVNAAQGDAARFTDVLAEYEKAPQITRRRLHLETMGRILQRSEKVMLDTKNTGNIMYLPLQKMLRGQASTGGTDSSSGGSSGSRSGSGSASSGQSQGMSQSDRTSEVRRQFEKRLEEIRRGEGGNR